MFNSNNKLIDLKRLLKISRSRLMMQEKLLKQKQQEYAKATAILNERLNNICKIKNQINSIRDYLISDPVRSSPDKLNRADAYLFWLNYDLEMHEYYHNQEKETAEEKKNEYIDTRGTWYKQKKKTEKLNELYIQGKSKKSNLLEELEGESVYEIRLNKG